MTTISHEPSMVGREERPAWLSFPFREMWAGLAIIVMWLAVLFDAIFGPNIVNTTAGGDNSSVPSAVAVAIFAFLATWVVAKYGFGGNRKDE